MSDQVTQLVSIDEKMAALIALLPTLQTELRFAGSNHFSPLFLRIDQLVEQLKQAHRLAISSPFSNDSEIDDPVSLLQQHQFLQAIYHSDGADHVQEQILENTQPFSLPCLLAAINSKNLWGECFRMFQQQPATWLLNVAEHLENSSPYHTHCQLKVAQQLSERQHLIGLLQNADQWYWDNNNGHFILAVIEQVDSLLVYNYNDQFEQEIETTMLNQLKQRLAECYQRIRLRT